MNKNKPEVGDIINYTKEVDTYVIDENEKMVKCKDIVQAKILSLLLKLNKKK